MKKILYISTAFPKERESSTIYTDLAVALVENGYQVTVVAAEEKKNAGKTEVVNERGCRILRVVTGNHYNVGIIEKGITYLRLSYQLKAAIKKYLSNEIYDLILFSSPPTTLAGVVEMAKKMYKAPAFLMMKDIFPQNAVDIGMMRAGSLVHRFFQMKEKKMYEAADKIGCMSEGNRRYIAEHSGISYQKSTIFPNTKRIQPLKNKDLSIRNKYKIPQDKVVFVFGGNMGRPQGMDFLIKAILECNKVEKAFFILVGRGTEREKVKTALSYSKNVQVLDNLPRDEYEQLITSCDVGIVSLDHRFTIPNYPSRILSYMEYAMPVLAATDANTDFKELIKEAECGYWCESDDTSAFVQSVSSFCENADLRITMGTNGRRYLEEHFCVEKSVEILQELQENRKERI